MRGGLVLAAVLLAGQAAAEMRLPDTVDPGERVRVTIEPPAREAARLTLTPLVQGESGPVAGGPAVLVTMLEAGAGVAEFLAPGRAGSYRLSLERDGRVRETARLEVAALPVGLSVPVRVFPATPFEVRWTRAGGTGDLLRVVSEGGATLSERRLGAEEAAAGVAEVEAPEASGRYRLAYVDRETRTVLAAMPFRVEAERAWLRAPFRVAPGGRVEVERHGPGGAGHALRIETEAGEAVRERTLADSTGPRGTVVLEAPAREGRYALVYLNLATGQELSRLPLLVRD
jgi:hypothetical protein